jgi:hypothetical protein
LPVAIGLLLLHATPRWRRAFQVVLTVLSTFLFLYNGLHIVQYMN